MGAGEETWEAAWKASALPVLIPGTAQEWSLSTDQEYALNITGYHPQKKEAIITKCWVTESKLDPFFPFSLLLEMEGVG